MVETRRSSLSLAGTLSSEAVLWTLVGRYLGMGRKKICHKRSFNLYFGKETIKKSTLVKLTSLTHFWVFAGKEICFQRLGCFSDDAPWAGIVERPLKILPWGPKEVNTRFLLYTNENPNNFQVRALMVFRTKFCLVYVIRIPKCKSSKEAKPDSGIYVFVDF